MNIWSRLLLHLRRAKLRQRFMKHQERLLDELRTQLLADTSKGCTWHDVELISEPILHVLPETDETPVALVGIAAIFTHQQENSTPQTQAGTAVFYFQDDAWQTHGNVLLNLTPSEALNQLSLKSMR